jgi:hypothetical protein
MGDSWTVATGQSEDINREVTLENRWTKNVANYFGLPELNLAVAGCGNLTIFQCIIEDIYKLKKEGKNPLVICSYTDPNRIELFHNNYNKLVVINESQYDPEFYKTYLTSYYDYDNCEKLSLYYITAIKNFLENNNIDYIDCWAFTPILESLYLDYSKTIDKTFLDIVGDEGRLLIPDSIMTSYGHANLKGNNQIANTVINKIISLYD